MRGETDTQLLLSLFIASLVLFAGLMRTPHGLLRKNELCRAVVSGMGAILTKYSVALFVATKTVCPDELFFSFLFII